MKNLQRLLVERAIHTVKATFPFHGYVEDTTEAIRETALILTGLCPDKGRLLDIGCGGMDKLAVFRKLGFECYGCDDFMDHWHRRDDNLERLMDFARKMDLHVHVQQGDYSIPWEEESFDVVTLLDVIEHLHESPREIMNFAGTYLKPNGLLVISMPNSVNLRKRLSVLVGHTNYPLARAFYENPSPWRGHVREYTLAETADMVRWSGFQIVLKRTFHAAMERRLSLRPLQWTFKAITTLAPTLRDGICVVGRKPTDWQPRLQDEAAFREAIGRSVPHGVA